MDKEEKLDKDMTVTEDVEEIDVEEAMANLNKLMETDETLKAVYDLVSEVFDEDDANAFEDLECVEIGEKTYIISMECEIDGTTYLYMMNEKDFTDIMVQKIEIEDGEEYLVDLDSEEEFQLVLAHFQRKSLLDVKEMMKKKEEKNPSEE